MNENQINYLYNKPGFSHLGFSVLASVVIITFYQSTLFLGSYLINTNSDYSYLLSIFVGVSGLLFLLLPTLVASRMSPLSFNTIFRLKKPNFALLILSAIGIFTFQIFVVGFSSLQASLIPDSLKEFYNMFYKSIESFYESLLGGNSYFDFAKGLIIGAIIPAISEEALFRGFLQRSLEERMKPFWAIIISGVAFGVIHMNLVSLIPLILIGIYLGIVAYYTGSIWVPVLVHFLNNFWAISFMYSTPLKNFEERTMEFPVFISLSLLIIGALMTTTILYYIIKLSKKGMAQNKEHYDII